MVQFRGTSLLNRSKSEFDILFFAVAWKVEGFLILDQASAFRKVIFRGQKHETHHCQIHNQQPEI